MKVVKAKSGDKVPLRMLSVDRLVPTPDNRRRPITQASVASLAKSMVKDGILQPVVVRPHPEKEGHWEIRAGERRWRAAKLAGITEIPAFVRKLDDEEALSVTIAENLQRENPHPLEEAATIQLAFDRGYDVKAVAARLGKTPQYIARRASLTKLSKAWTEEILKPESDASRFTVEHLELIARLPEETQNLLSEDGFATVFRQGFPGVGDLRRIIERGLRSLKAMPWKLDDETLEPKAGSCLNCPKRSGLHPLLFEAEDAPQGGKVSKTDRCLDPGCFERKQVAHVIGCESALRQEHPGLQLVQVGIDRLPDALRASYPDRIIHLYNPKVVKSSAQRATPAMLVSGPKAGTLEYFDLGDREPMTGNTGKGGSEGSAKKAGPLTLAERKARLQKRRDAFLVGRVNEQLRALTPELLAKTVVEIQVRTDDAAKRFDPLALVLAFGTSTRADRDHDEGAWIRYEELLARKAELPLATALHEVVQVWARRLGGSDTHAVTAQANDALRICEILGIDSMEIESEAATAIPTPKSWASLSDNSTAVIEIAPFEPTGRYTPDARSGKTKHLPVKHRGK